MNRMTDKVKEIIKEQEGIAENSGSTLTKIR